MSARAMPITEKHNSAAFAFTQMRGRSIVAVALAIPLILAAMLLSGTARIATIGGILFIVGMLVDFYRFEVDLVLHEVRIRTLWLGWQERGAVTYAFADVLRLEKTSGAYNAVFRWRFKDGATYELPVPVGERLYELFREKEDAGVMKRENNADYSYGPDWRLVDRAGEVVLEPNVVRDLIGAWSFCGAIVAVFSLLAVRGSVSAFAAMVAAAVCGVLAVLVALYVVSETRKGPWLRFDRVRRRLILPRWGLEFDSDALVAWETKCMHWGVGSQTRPVTELQLVVRAAGGEKRYELLACYDHSTGYWWRAARSRFVRALAEELSALTGLPVREANKHIRTAAAPVSRQTVAAFIGQRDAEAFCDKLRAAGLDATVVESPFAASDERSPMRVFEVQVEQYLLIDAGPIVRRCTILPRRRRQLTLRSLFEGLTFACIVLAILHYFAGGGPWAIAVGTLFVVSGVAAISFGVTVVFRGRASWHWPRAPGRITQAGIWPGRNSKYQSHIRYRYQVDGREYETDTVSYLFKTDSYETDRAEVMRFPVGLEVDVFYDPIEPSIAVLQRGLESADVLAVGVFFGLVFIIVGIALFEAF